MDGSDYKIHTLLAAKKVSCQLGFAHVDCRISRLVVYRFMFCKAQCDNTKVEVYKLLHTGLYFDFGVAICECF